MYSQWTGMIAGASQKGIAPGRGRAETWQDDGSGLNIRHLPVASQPLVA
jgi:hypothetical protein